MSVRFAAMATLLLLFSIQGAASALPKARFEFIAYSAEASEAPPKGAFLNPILPGFHPDPTITAYKDEYLLVTSTFAWMPGFPVYRSKDLINWRLASHAVTPDSGFKMDGLGVARGMFAPAITAHAGRLYVISTCVDCGGNFIVTADNPEGPWSKPVWLDFEGIDPSLFFDDDGRGWVVNNGAPVGAAEYDGHRAIWIQQFDLPSMKLIGPRSVLVDKGIRPAEKPIWIEGPHIYRKDGYYYLLAAEGGTADQHSQTIFRSRQITGPYEVGPVNPILTQRNLDRSRPDRVEATGHADIVELPDGRWWAVFLATRPYKNQFTSMGRETFLLPVDWRDGWPQILADGTPVPLMLKTPLAGDQRRTPRWRDNFDTKSLSGDWIWLRTGQTNAWLDLESRRGVLTLSALPVAAGSLQQPAFVGRRLQHHNAQVETQMAFQPASDGDRAGLLALIDENHFLFAGVERIEGKDAFVVRRRAHGTEKQMGELIGQAAVLPWSKSGPRHFDIRLNFAGGKMSVAWRQSQKERWRSVLTDIDSTFLASVNAGLFTGTVVGPHASSTSGY